MKRNAFLLIVLLPVLVIAFVGGANARLITAEERLEPGVDDRGYMLSADDQASYSLWAPPGMVAEELHGATRLEPSTGLNAAHNWLWLIQNAFNVDGVSGEARDVLNVRQGFTATDLEALGLSPDNLGDKRLDAITIGPPLDDSI